MCNVSLSAERNISRNFMKCDAENLIRNLETESRQLGSWRKLRWLASRENI
jgi:hypothetical protein